MATRPTRPTGGINPAGRQRPVVRPIYEDIKPISEWIQDVESDILLIHLPGFMRENLKVSTEGINIIRVRGERLVAGNKWQRFQEDYQVPDYCNLRGTRARFEGGMLTIAVPRKSVSQIGPKDEAKPSEQQASAAPGKAQDDLPAKPAAPSIVKPKQSSPEKARRERTPQKKQDYVPARVAPSPKDEAKAVGEAPSPKGQEDIPPKPSSTIVGDKQKDQTYSEPPATQKMLNEEKPPTISGEKQTDLKNSEALMASEHVVQQDAERRENNETKSKPGKSEISQSAEKSKGSQLLDQIERVTKRISEKPKVEKDRAGFVHERKAEHVEPKTKQTTDASTSRTGHYNLENFKQSVKSLAERDEEKQLLVNVGVAVLVIVALGTYVYNTTIGQ